MYAVPHPYFPCLLMLSDLCKTSIDVLFETAADAYA
ncbi:hypothetical protein [Scytonema sp. UIC 10036]|nr:hypothetical protein [Scytonema sp. UIC 10036]